MSSAPDPAFDDFQRALGSPDARAALGIQLSGADARLLVARSDWAETYWRQWRGERVAAEPGAPVALPRAVALAPALVLPQPVADAPEEPVAPRWWRRGRAVRVGVVALATGSVLAATLVLVTAPHPSADAAADPGRAASDPFPAGLDASAAPSPTPSAATGDPKERLSDEVSAALRLDERTAAAPAVSGIVEREVARIADVACIGGYDDATAQQVAQAVAGEPDLDEEAGYAVADAIARYCAATVG